MRQYVLGIRLLYQCFEFVFLCQKMIVRVGEKYREMGFLLTIFMLEKRKKIPYFLARIS